MFSFSKSAARKLRLWRLAADRRGVAAVEFALILPVMVLMYLGGFEVLQGIAIDRMTAIAASTVTNLVSQYSTISSTTQMPDILNASSQVLTPYPFVNAHVVVSCISVDGAGHATIAWSQAINGAARVVGASYTLPAALDVPNTQVILGETTYVYTPTIDFMSLGTINLYASDYMLPRSSTTIALTP
jgi:Flp pilus assembly protein TadG